mmetsp:Transcript_124148/g.397065  ORF Transcript_124148/g.397065 Transcript_124148/m.397065 type:complete len:1196 (+) Transcript_124148:144-3731(+)
MVLEHAASALLGAGASVWGRTIDGADLVNGTFNSLVSVTGDAHQAQVAQDIFRQEVRIERSLRVREDIRDAHQLMIENVQTQLLMGNLMLGVCFTVLIEGSPSDRVHAPVLVQELWAVFAVWSISLLFLAVWFALQYQERVSISSRQRLLQKHRVTHPNDEVFGRLGGLSLAEKVSQLHQRGLIEFAAMLESKVGWVGARERLVQSISHVLPTVECGMKGKKPITKDVPTIGKDFSINQLNARFDRQPSAATNVTCTPGPDMQFQDSLPPPLEVRLLFPGDSAATPSGCSPRRQCRGTGGVDCNGMERRQRQQLYGDFVTVRAARGTRAWLDEETKKLSHQHFVDLPDFLVDETLLRCPWSLPSKDGRKSVSFMVRGTATVYVAALWPPPDTNARGQGPPPNWADEELPILHGGQAQLERVEGFSVLVNDRAMEMPLYRAVLKEPSSDGWRRVRLKFRFGGQFEAPVIIVRRGAIVTSEEDWPVREFFNELDEIQPLRDDSLSFMSHGVVNLLLAAFFAHLGRISTDRPWPMCMWEVIFVLFALLPALIIAGLADKAIKHVFYIDLASNTRFEFGETTAEASARGGAGGATKQFADDNPAMSLPDEELFGKSGNGEFEHSLAQASLVSLASCGSISSTTACLPHFAGASVAAGAEGAAVSRAAVGGCILGKALFGACSAPETQGSARLVEWKQQQGRDDEIVIPGMKAHRIGISEEMLVEKLKEQDDDEETVEPGAEDDWEETVEDEATSPMIAGTQGNGQANFGEQTTRSLSSVLQILKRPSDDSINYSWWRWCQDPRSFCQWRKPQKRMFIFKIVVRILWATSVLGVVLSRVLSTALVSTVLGMGAYPGDVRTCTLGGDWSVHDVAWPTPLFAPGSAAFMPDGRGLWLASDWLLAPLATFAEDHTGALTLGGITRLPLSASGLLLVPTSNRIFVAGTGALNAFELDNFTEVGFVGNEVGPIGMEVASRSKGGSLRGGARPGSFGVLGESRAFGVLHPSVARSPLAGKIRSSVALPVAQLGKIGAMVAAIVPSEVGRAVVVVALAPETGGIFLSVAVDLEALSGIGPPPSLEIAVRVPQPFGAPAVRAMHLCAEPELCGAGEPVLWAADLAGCLTAVGLGSGKVLGSWRWSEVRSTPDGSRGSTTAATVAVAGNTSHLFVIAPCTTGLAPALLSAPYDTLLGRRAHFADGCAHP